LGWLTYDAFDETCSDVDLSLSKMLSGPNPFEISDIERMNMGRTSLVAL